MKLHTYLSSTNYLNIHKNFTITLTIQTLNNHIHDHVAISIETKNATIFIHARFEKTHRVCRETEITQISMSQNQ